MPSGGASGAGHPQQAPCASSAILKADEELEAAALLYEERQPGLGDVFLDRFGRMLRRIVAEPERWRKIRGDNRKLNFHGFPYAIVYSVRADAIYVNAMMHLHRRPFYWMPRQFPA